MDYRASRRVTDNLATGEEEKIGNSTVISIEEKAMLPMQNIFIK